MADTRDPFRREWFGEWKRGLSLADLHPLPWSVRRTATMSGSRYAQDFTFVLLDARGKLVGECEREDVAFAVAQAVGLAERPGVRFVTEFEQALRGLLALEGDKYVNPSFREAVTERATMVLKDLDEARRKAGG